MIEQIAQEMIATANAKPHNPDVSFLVPLESVRETEIDGVPHTLILNKIQIPGLPKAAWTLSIVDKTDKRPDDAFCQRLLATFFGDGKSITDITAPTKELMQRSGGKWANGHRQFAIMER